MARILLADDDDATRDLVRRALETDGHAVHVTEDGSAALDALMGTTSPFDLLITDVQMPSLDGISLVERAVAHTPGLRIILMSGFPEQLGRAASLGARRLEIVTKPFTLEQIRARVRTSLA
jgi:DNA-binding response OmpR family regulator